MNKSRMYAPFNMTLKSTIGPKREMRIIPTNSLLMLYRGTSGGKGLSRTVAASTVALEVRSRPLPQSTTIEQDSIHPKGVSRRMEQGQLRQGKLHVQTYKHETPPKVEDVLLAGRAKTSPRSHVTGKPDAAKGEMNVNSPTQASRSPARPLLPVHGPAVLVEVTRRTSGRRTRGASGTRADVDPDPMVLESRKGPKVPGGRIDLRSESRLQQFVLLHLCLHRPLKDLPPERLAEHCLSSQDQREVRA